MHHDGLVNADERTEWVVGKARTIGFDLCGVAPAEKFEELQQLPEWLARDYAGEMKYLRDPRRGDPALVLDGARSIVVCALNYRTPQPYSTEVPASTAGDPPRGWISRYAWGDDYHDFLGAKLDALVRAMREKFSESFEARAYVDTGPIVERIAAHHAGLGWLAKNTMLINERLGSWLFLGVILTTLELAPSAVAAESLPADLCGNCRLCIDACPTGAIVEPYVLDARRCISYLTIELRGAIPEEFRPAMGRMIFGCDICQDVCPWNRNAPVTQLAEFMPRMLPLPRDATGNITDGSRDGAEDASLFAPSLDFFAAVTPSEFSETFRGSAVKRTKWRGLMRNACVALGNSKVARGTELHAKIEATLEHLVAADDPVIAEHARWALDRLNGAD
ncbi:MAG: tRNA epoxyqueuosine(34) reductase QueG [Candidatus Acidiferrales bacterium]|jgi:epoxyqueuosine reductase